MSGFNMWLCCALLKLLFFPGFVSLACFSVWYFLTTVKQIILDNFLLNQFQNSAYSKLILLIWSSVTDKCSMISQHNLFSLFLTNFWWGRCKLAKIVLQNHTTVLGCCSRDAAKTFKCSRSANIGSSRDGCLPSALMSEYKHCQSCLETPRPVKTLVTTCWYSQYM